MTLRKILFWIHLSVGTVAGLVILVMSITGVLLAYERQITEWLDLDYVSPFSGQHLAMGDLVGRAQKVRGRQPSTIRIQADSTAPVEFGFSPGIPALLLDPHTGAILRDGDGEAHEFFSIVEAWHRRLGANNGDPGQLGRNITGICNLLFFVLVISGPFLWWPRNVTWLRAKRTLWFQPGLIGRCRNFNWHNVIGIWCFFPLAIIVLSGIVMSYAWANNLLYRLTGNEPPPVRGAAVESDRSRNAQAGRAMDFSSLDALFRRAGQQVPNWTRISLRLPSSQAPLVFTIEVGGGGRPDRRSQLTLNPESGEVLKWEPFSSYNAGRRLRSWARFAHTGEAGGFLGQTVALAATAGAVLLVWTGLSLALARFRTWRNNRSDHAA